MPWGRGLVNAAWLANRLKTHKNVRVLDGSWHMPASKRDPWTDFLSERIPGAMYFDVDKIADTRSSYPHMLPSPHKFAKAVEELGISNEDEVIVYDVHGVFSAPRVWWTFRVFGHRNVAVLDGGLPGWKSEGREVESGPVTPVKPGIFTPHFHPDLVKSYEQMLDNVKSREFQVADARSAGRFKGTEPEPRAGLSSGHMPGSVSVPFGTLIDGSKGVMRPDVEIQAILQKSGVDLEKPLVASCGSGMTACVVAFAANLVGKKDVAVYDGAWTEWASRAGSPIEKSE
eukprot:Colp12_sorted_trinity150504_noHs@34671